MSNKAVPLKKAHGRDRDRKRLKNIVVALKENQVYLGGLGAGKVIKGIKLRPE